MIISMSPKIKPGILFQVLRKGFGKTPGSIFLNRGGNNYYAAIEAGSECYVGARLMPELSGVRATNYAPLILKTAEGKETTKTTGFQPLLEFNNLYIDGSLRCWRGSNNWILNNFQLKNDWFVISRDLQYDYTINAHAEITYASDLNVLNGSAKTGVHAGCDLFSDADPCILWYLTTCISGPKGLSY
jgi:hypothetical protein